MKYSVCIDALYFGKDTSLTQQVEEITLAGFDTIEFWTWWDKDIDELQKACLKFGVEIECFCTMFITLLDPAERAAYMDALKDTFDLAKKLGVSKVITQVGNTIGSASLDQQEQSLVSGLKEAGDIAEAYSGTLLVEPLNTRVDHGGYFLSSSDKANAILDKVGSTHVKMLFDVYHQQISEGDISRHIIQSAGYIGHFHIAGNPGRDRPGTGELDYNNILPLMGAKVPAATTGLEYFPAGSPLESLIATKGLLGL